MSSSDRQRVRHALTVTLTLRTTYKYHDLFRPSACQARIFTSHLLLLCRLSGATWPASTHYRIVQALFDEDTDRPPVTKCSVISCPLKTVSKFTASRTQPHWAHMSDVFLSVPPEWCADYIMIRLWLHHDYIMITL